MVGHYAGFSRDGLPLVGAIPGNDNVLLGAGFTGHGFAWLAGQSLATMIADTSDTFADLCSPRLIYLIPQHSSYAFESRI